MRVRESEIERVRVGVKVSDRVRVREADAERVSE